MTNTTLETHEEPRGKEEEVLFYLQGEEGMCRGGVEGRFTEYRRGHHSRRGVTGSQPSQSCLRTSSEVDVVDGVTDLHLRICE